MAHAKCVHDTSENLPDRDIFAMHKAVAGTTPANGRRNLGAEKGHEGLERWNKAIMELGIYKPKSLSIYSVTSSSTYKKNENPK